jgi:SAM-dependent methyltransferase
MVKRKDNDGFGQMLLRQLKSSEQLVEIIERDDNFIDTGSEPGLYSSEYKQCKSAEKQAMKRARGRVLDIGCGAGRHSLYLQEKGLEVTGIDNSPGAIRVCKARGVKKAIMRSIEDISKFKTNSFDTVLMMGNNFGLMASPERAKVLLRELLRITSKDAVLIAGTLNPYGTKNPDHLKYHKFNRRRGRMPGQLTIRARFGTTIGEWFDYLFVSPTEMRQLLKDSGWKIEATMGPTDDRYFAIIRKAPVE